MSLRPCRSRSSIVWMSLVNSPMALVLFRNWVPDSRRNPNVGTGAWFHRCLSLPATYGLARKPAWSEIAKHQMDEMIGRWDEGRRHAHSEAGQTPSLTD